MSLLLFTRLTNHKEMYMPRIKSVLAIALGASCLVYVAVSLASCINAKKQNQYSLPKVTQEAQDFSNTYGPVMLIWQAKSAGPYVITISSDRVKDAHIIHVIRPEHKPSASKTDLALWHQIVKL